MIKQVGKYLFFGGVFIACLFSVCTAQLPFVKTSLDKNKILIGEQFKLTIAVNFPADDYKISWLSVPDSMRHFEVLDRSGIDSIYDSNKLTGITQTFTLTSFDSGQWIVPPFGININVKKNDSIISLYTDSLRVNVSYSPLDTTNHFKEIKPIRDVEVDDYLWWWIAGAVLLLVIIIALIWYYRRHKKTKPVKTTISKVSAYEQAMNELNALKKHPLSNREEIKSFHSKLSEIFRSYLSVKENTDYRIKTTSDILLTLNDGNIDKTSLSEAASALRCSDAVKFAKYIPAANENMNCLVSIKNIIELLNK